MKILDYKKSNKDGNIQGYLTLALDVAVDGNLLQMTLDVTLIRNSITGDLFVSWPSRSYVTPEGQTKYAPQMRWPKEQLDYIQKVIINMFLQQYGRAAAPPAQTRQIKQELRPYAPSQQIPDLDGCPF